MLSVTRRLVATEIYPPVFFGEIHHVEQVVVDVSELTTKEVDADGYLKPGVPFKVDGTLADGTSGEYIWAVNHEPQKLHLATIPPTDATLAADTSTVPLGMATEGRVNRDVAEDILTRAYTANELAAFTAAGSHIRLSRT